MTLTGYDDSGPGDNLANLKVTCDIVSGYELLVEVTGSSGAAAYSGSCVPDGATMSLDPYMSYTVSLYQRAASSSARTVALEGSGWELVESRTIPSALSGCKVYAGDRRNTVVCYDKGREETNFRVCWAASAFTSPDGDGVTCTDFTIEQGASIVFGHTGLTNGDVYYYSVMALSGSGGMGVSLPSSQSGAIRPHTPVSGCTDATATNYNSKAEKDDGSCAYTVATNSGGSSSGGGGSSSASCTGSTTATAMVTFAGGGFTMGWSGANADSPEHTVTLSGFSIETKEVTQTQFQAVCGSNPSSNIGGTLPVERVTWQEASDYCAAIGRRLPTEAEWEYSARDGGTEATSAYANGSTTVPPECSAGTTATPGANYNNCNGATIAVGSYSASDSGLFDMAGNVYEWVGDWYDGGYYANGQVDPTGPASGTYRVLRGGSLDDNPYYLRASNRGWNDPDARVGVTGFRCSQ